MVLLCLIVRSKNSNGSKHYLTNYAAHIAHDFVVAPPPLERAEWHFGGQNV